MKHRAFTLMELIIGLLILCVLGSIASPAFFTLMDTSKEGHTKGGMATIRGAISVYNSDNGAYPTDDLHVLYKDKKYLVKLPRTRLPNTPHGSSRNVFTASGEKGINDVGGWAYDNDKNSPDWGKVRVNCLHKNSDSEIWSSL